LPLTGGSVSADITVNGLTVGRGAGAVSTNTAVGASALAGNTSGASNSSLGYQALYSNTTASSNTAVGYQAGYTNSTGGSNIFLGYQSGYTCNANNNTAIGYQAGYLLTSGVSNTFVGSNIGTGSAGYYVTSGSKNSILGNYNGNQGGLDIRTASNYIVLSDGDGNPRAFCGSSGVFSFPSNFLGIWQGSSNSNLVVNDGAQMYPSPDNILKLGFPSFRWTTVYATTGTINTSDANQKQDIASLDDAEKRVAVAIKSLIKKYRFKDAVAEKGDAARIHVGAVAQEVQAAFVAEGLNPARYALFCSDTWYEVDGKAGLPAEPFTAETEGAVEVTRLGLRYEELLAFVIAAL
jgi:hypothetical protein